MIRDLEAFESLTHRSEVVVGFDYGFVFTRDSDGRVETTTGRFTLGEGEYEDRIGIAQALSEVYPLTELEADAWAAAVYGAAVALVTSRA